MGAFTYTDEKTSSIPPARLFKAFIVDSHNLIPKLLPQVFTSIDFIGDGGVGTLKQINFPGGVKFMKYHVDELNEEMYTYKYSLIESAGDEFLSKVDKITYEIKFVASEDGGTTSSKIVLTTNCYTKDEFEIKEEDMKDGRERVMGLYKVIEGYLIQNPDAYAIFQSSQKYIIMGAFTFTDERSSSIPPARLFKAFIVDSHNLLQKLMPEVFASINFLQGDGGVGTLKQINFAEGANFLKYHVDELNEETYTYKYTLIESAGDELLEKVEKITYEIKFEGSTDGGITSSKIVMTTICYTKDGFQIKDEDIKESSDKVLGLYKVVEGYLLENPDEYA